MQHETMSPEAATDARAAVTLCGRAVRDAVKLLTGKLVERRQTVPVLSAILFDIAPDGRATLTATDCDVWASLTLSADSYDGFEPGRFCLDAAALHKLLSKAGKLERVRFTDTGAGRVILKAGRSEYKVPTRKADDFPLAPISAYQAERGGAIDRAQFLRDLAALAPAAMNAEETRYYLHGVALQVREFAGRERFVSVATDGYSMAVASRDLLPGFEGWADCLMPRKAVSFLMAADKLAGAGDMTLSRSGTHLSVECGALLMVSKLGEGTYPDWPRAFDQLCTPTEGDEPALFPELLPNWPLERTEALQKAAAVSIDWSDANGGVIGQSADDAGMIWGAMYLFGNPATGRAYDEKLTVDVAGDREYLVPSTASKIGLSKEQVAALCGDELWNVLELPGADGRPRYVSAWCYEQGDSRLLCVGKDGRCPKADAPREYVSREQVAAAMAGEAIAVAAPAIEDAAPTVETCEPVSAPETALVCDAEPVPATHAAEMPESAPIAAPVAAEPVIDAAGDPIAAVRARLAEIEALLATLPAQSAQPKRTAAHERAIRRAWAERKAARAMRFNAQLARDMAANNLRAAEFQRERAEAAESQLETVKAAYDRSGDERRELRKSRDDWEGQAQRNADKARLADAVAAEALAMRDEMRAMLAALERRAEAAEAENAELWAEIEALTAPITAAQGAIPVRQGAA